MQIREATEADREATLAVEGAAFDDEEIPALVGALLDDPTAEPRLSLLAVEDGAALGHVLFTRARIDGAPEVESAILAPLAVAPAAQRRGVGGALIAEGLRILKERGVGLVFVLGHPGYYPRHGFAPAGRQGLQAPYAIPEEAAEAWMVQALRPGLLGAVTGTLRCADALMRPEHWRE